MADSGMKIVEDEEETGNVYWSRAGPDSTGVVVALTWMLCKPPQFRTHSHLYASYNWDSLIVHSPILNLWFPSKAETLATRVLNKLVQDLQNRPRPVFFAAFSGGIKACLYKIIQVLDAVATDNSLCSQEKYRVVRDCYAGQILDSCPVDFASKLGADFVSHPVNYGGKRRSAALTWSAHALGRVLDAMFFSRIEAQRLDMWITLEKSWTWGPVLVLCSKDDDLADYQVIQNFSERMSSRGCKVTLIVWEHSAHVAHLKIHPDEYTSAVQSFLADVAPSLRLQLNCEPDDEFPSASVNGQVIKGSIKGSASSSPAIRKAVPERQSSIKLQAETSDDGIARTFGDLLISI